MDVVCVDSLYIEGVWSSDSNLKQCYWIAVFKGLVYENRNNGDYFSGHLSAIPNRYHLNVACLDCTCNVCPCETRGHVTVISVWPGLTSGLDGRQSLVRFCVRRTAEVHIAH